MTVEQIERELHEAAERIWDERGSAEMDTLAQAIGEFIRTSDFFAADRSGAEELAIDGPSFGYGCMIGWLARGTV